MNLLILTTILFGSYDLLIKLSSNSNHAGINALVVQLASVCTIALGLIVMRAKPHFELGQSLLPMVAGVVIGLALILLFTLLATPHSKASVILTTTLIGRNLILIVGSTLLLKESLNPYQVIGIIFSLSGIYLLNR